MEILNGKKIFVTGLDPLFLGQGLAFGTSMISFVKGKTEISLDLPD